MKLISVVTPCFNEETNVEEVYARVKAIFAELPQYRYEHVFIDNASTDLTVPKLKFLASRDKNVKIIVNAGNFGPLKSPHHALLQVQGDAAIMLVADLQDPPELITRFLEEWEGGSQIVLGTKPKAEENPVMFAVRKLYYKIMSRISERDHVEHFTSYALYDRSFIDILRRLDEPNPYIRGLVAEFGLKRSEIAYIQPRRKRGKSSARLYTLFDIAMLGFVNNSKVPLRMAIFIGFFMASLSLVVAMIVLVLKLLYWEMFPIGIAALIVGVFFFSSVQLFFIGIIGEYVGAVYTQVKRRPLVVEKERINFEEGGILK